MTVRSILPLGACPIHRREAFLRRNPLPAALVAPAYFLGVQDCAGVVPDIELWNLTESIPGHPAGSTVSRQTIEAAGYVLPRALTLGRAAA